MTRERIIVYKDGSTDIHTLEEELRTKEKSENSPVLFFAGLFAELFEKGKAALSSSKRT